MQRNQVLCIFSQRFDCYNSHYQGLDVQEKFTYLFKVPIKWKPEEIICSKIEIYQILIFI